LVSLSNRPFETSDERQTPPSERVNQAVSAAARAHRGIHSSSQPVVPAGLVHGPGPRAQRAAKKEASKRAEHATGALVANPRKAFTNPTVITPQGRARDGWSGAWRQRAGCHARPGHREGPSAPRRRAEDLPELRIFADPDFADLDTAGA